MKISKSTIAILKNFAEIQPGIIIAPGSELRTTSSLGHVFAVSSIDETFPVKFTITELSKFLNALSLFDDPDITFRDDNLLIKDSSGGTSLKYVYGVEDLVAAPPAGTPKLNDPLITFELTQAELEQIHRAAGTLKVNDIMVEVDDGKVSVVVRDQKNATDEFRILRGEAAPEAKANIFVNYENMKLMKMPYRVAVYKTPKGKYLIRFFNDVVSYWISSESTSTANI